MIPISAFPEINSSSPGARLLCRNVGELKKPSRISLEELFHIRTCRGVSHHAFRLFARHEARALETFDERMRLAEQGGNTLRVRRLLQNSAADVCEQSADHRRGRLASHFHNERLVALRKINHVSDQIRVAARNENLVRLQRILAV